MFINLQDSDIKAINLTVVEALETTCKEAAFTTFTDFDKLNDRMALNPATLHFYSVP